MKKDNDFVLSVCIIMTVVLIILKLSWVIDEIPWWVVLSPIPLYYIIIAISIIVAIIVCAIYIAIMEVAEALYDIFLREHRSSMRNDSMPIIWDPITKQLYGKYGPMTFEEDEEDA